MKGNSGKWESAKGMHITWLTRSSDWYIRFMTVSPALRNIFLLFSALHGFLWCIRTFISEAIRTKLFFFLYLSQECLILWYRNYLLYKRYVWIPLYLFYSIRYLKSFRCFNILTRQRVSNKVYKIRLLMQTNLPIGKAPKVNHLFDMTSMS